jgi:hypothetical protein
MVMGASTVAADSGAGTTGAAQTVSVVVVIEILRKVR